MSEIHLTKSPIREAIVDFKFTFIKPVELKQLESAHENLKKDYPIKEVIDMNSLFFDMSAGNKPKMQHTQGKVGYRFINNEKDIIVQFRVDGFTFSKVKPYTSWEEIYQKVKDAYNLYIKITTPKSITRIATRYINFIELDQNETIDFKKYFTIYPTLPNVLDGTLVDNFLMRISLKSEENGIKSIVSEGLVVEKKPISLEEIKSLLLDIDCFQDNLNLKSDNPWVGLDKIKDHTNKVFFSSITDFSKDKFK